MRILLIHPHDILSKLEPWTSRIVSVAHELISRNHEVKLIYHVHPETGLPENMTEGKHSHYRVAPVTGPQDFPFEIVPVSRDISLRDAVKRISPYVWWADVVHLQKALTYAAIPVLYSCFRLKKSLHYDWDDWESGILAESGGTGMPLFLMRISEQILPLLADTVSVASRDLYQRARKSGVHPARLGFAPVGVDLERFRPGVSGGEQLAKRLGMDEPGCRYITYHGQLQGAFGLELLIRAAAKILPGYTNWRLIIAGEGHMRKEMEKLVEDLGRKQRTVGADFRALVKFVGPLKHEEIPALLSLAHIGAAPFAATRQSATKSPLKVVEMLASGVPTVATNIGEVPGMTGDAALLVEPDDCQAMATGLKKLMDNEELRRELASKARAQAERHLSWSKTVDNLLNLYEVAAERRHRPSLRAFLEDNLDLMGIVTGRVFTGPRLIQLDPTGNCNNDCIACWVRSPLHGRPPEQNSPELSTGRVLKLLHEAWQLGTRELYIAGGGEPFCHPGIWDIIEYAKKLRMIVTVNTNFTLLDAADMQRLIDLQVDWMTVSVWAGSPEVYARTHPNRGPQAFWHIRDNLRILLRDRVDAPRIKIYNVVFNMNYQDVRNMMSFARHVGADGVEFTVADVIPGATDSLLLNQVQRRWLLEEMLSIVAEERRMGGGPAIIGLDRFMARLSDDGAGTGDYDAAVIDQIPCTVGWTFLRIMPDGSVNPCLKTHRWPTGNINRISLKKAWYSPRQWKFRKACFNRPENHEFFRFVGNDPGASCGCYRGCDDVARNADIQRRLQELGNTGRKLLYIAGCVRALKEDLRALIIRKDRKRDRSIG